MNLQEETRRGYTISAEMKAVWAIQLEMVKYLLNVCEKYGLNIWAEAGTLLGAVREKGYIPWDDDIDLMMLRDDYDKLIAVADKEITSPYHFQSFGREKQYYRGHAQMRYDGTAAVLSSDIWKPFHQGIFIDIFVYDSIPDDGNPDWKAALTRADQIQSILESTSFRGRMTSLKLCLETVKSFFYCLRKGKKKLVEEYENLFKQFNIEENEWIAPPCFLRYNLDRLKKKKEWYKETIQLPFEDILLPAPSEYDKVLKLQYGDDYMIPKKAPTIHGSVYFNTERDYKAVVKELRKNRLREKMSVLTKCRQKP